MNLLTIVQQFCQRTGLAIPSAVVGSTDKTVTQLQGLLNELVEDLSRWQWQEVTRQVIITTIADEDQGPLLSVVGPDFEEIMPETFFNRTQHLRVEGPLSAEEWQAIKATTFSAPRYYWRIRENNLLLTPEPTAGQTLAFEYYSKHFVQSADGLTSKQWFTADTDEFLLDSRLLTFGLRWAWKKEKGLTYAEELRTYEEFATKRAGRSQGGRTLSMGPNRPIVPGVIVPSGNWMQP